MEKQYFVYIITNKSRSVLYTGFTNNLQRRIYEHKNKLIEGFSSRYNLNQLVYYEIYPVKFNAIEREKQIKQYSRKRKEKLIESMNVNWNDLGENL